MNYIGEINIITGRFKELSAENKYCHYSMSNYKWRLTIMFSISIVFYIFMTLYDIYLIGFENTTGLYLLRLITVLSAGYCIYFLHKKNKSKYMMSILLFLLMFCIIPLYYNHILMEHTQNSFSFETSIFILTVYAITLGALLLIPFIFFLIAVILQNILFFVDYRIYKIDLFLHTKELLIYLLVLIFIIFVSYNFNVMLRRNFYDRYILSENLRKSNLKLAKFNGVERAFLTELTAQVIAHEIKNIIGVISGYAQMLLSFKGLNKNQKKIVENIKKASDKSDNYIKEIRNLSVGKVDIRKYNIVDIIYESSHLWTTSAEKFKSKIKINLSDCNVKVDSMLLQGAISNIVRNAIESKQNSVINIENIIFKNEVHIVISNDKKIEINNNQDIYNLFKNNKNKKESTGIGLPFSKSVVEKFGGSINFKTKNKKTIFTFILPIV